MGNLRYCGDPKAGTSTPKSETIVDWGPTVARGRVDTGACCGKTRASSFVFFLQLSRRVASDLLRSALPDGRLRFALPRSPFNMDAWDTFYTF